jgi:hypothetical protein
VTSFEARPKSLRTVADCCDACAGYTVLTGKKPSSPPDQFFASASA